MFLKSIFVKLPLLPLLFGIVCIIVVIIAFYFFVITNKHIKPAVTVKTVEELSAMSSSQELTYWMDMITSVGDKKAYETFGTLFKQQSYQVQHTHAHVFGEALYKTSGIPGIAVCDSNFGFGCYHSFFAWALLSNGIGIIKNLDQACIAVYGEKGLGCQHGIGHGVLSELGRDKLPEALTLCATLNWQGPIGGCTSGVFMENNFNTMGDQTVRTIEKDDLQYPCDSDIVSERFKEACYFEQPSWWAALRNNDFTFVGQQCAKALTLKEREACFRGTGNMIAGAREYDAQGMLNACNAMPDKESNLLCIEGATWLMSAQPEFKGMWEVMCAKLEGDAHQRCLDSKNLI